jgi:isoleucyl-tRNA synthetase
VILSISPVAPYRSFLFQGHVLDENGNKMSKSVGNVIDAKMLLANNAVDLIRFYFMWKSSPIEALNFSIKEMVGRPHQILSTLYFLHIYFEQNSSYDKFNKHTHSLSWATENNLLGIAEIWLLSKLQTLKRTVTNSFERCRFHDGSKAIEDFVINIVSQTYVPMIRNDIWQDNIETLQRRYVIYSVLGHTLLELEKLLHPLAPFITEYLYQKCFRKKESIMLEDWPIYDESYIDIEIERSFNIVKDIISLANAARTKGHLKRRWPVNKVLIGCTDPTFINSSGIGEVLRTQLNTEEYNIVGISETKHTIDHITSLLDNKLPIVVRAALVTRNVASKLKDKRILLVKQAFGQTDSTEILRSLRSAGSYALKYNGGEITLSNTDVELSYEASEGFEMSSQNDLIVFVSTGRDDKLIAKGILRDLARNLQQVRKEKGYNPTDILSAAYVAYLDNEDINSISDIKEDLTYLVRVKSVVVTKQPIEKVKYKDIELDGRKLLLAVV